MTDSIEAPDGPQTKGSTRNLVNSIWKAGWTEGNTHGYKLGYTNGSSTLGRGWFFATAMIFLLAGIVMGFGLDYFKSCVPVVVNETKSCISQGDL